MASQTEKQLAKKLLSIAIADHGIFVIGKFLFW